MPILLKPLLWVVAYWRPPRSFVPDLGIAFWPIDQRTPAKVSKYLPISSHEFLKRNSLVVWLPAWCKLCPNANRHTVSIQWSKGRLVWHDLWGPQRTYQHVAHPQEQNPRHWSEYSRDIASPLIPSPHPHLWHSEWSSTLTPRHWLAVTRDAKEIKHASQAMIKLENHSRIRWNDDMKFPTRTAADSVTWHEDGVSSM